MRFLVSVAAIAAAALSVAACGKSGTQSAYLNSGASATPAMPAEQTGDAAVSQAPAVSDTVSPQPSK